jgi:hypothetical protein
MSSACVTLMTLTTTFNIHSSSDDEVDAHYTKKVISATQPHEQAVNPATSGITLCLHLHNVGQGWPPRSAWRPDKEGNNQLRRKTNGSRHGTECYVLLFHASLH